MNSIQNTYSVQAPLAPALGVVAPSRQVKSESSIEQVNFSDAGKELAMSGGSIITGVDAFALPSWMGQYLPPLNDLSSSQQAIKDGAGYTKLANKLSADGALSLGEKKGLQTYLDNSESSRELKARVHERAALQAEINEYGGYVNEAFKASVSSIGANSITEYNQKIRSDSSMEQAAHTVFRETLLANPRTISLMKVLGVD